MGILVHGQLLGTKRFVDCGYLQGVGLGGEGRDLHLSLDIFCSIKISDQNHLLEI